MLQVRKLEFQFLRPITRLIRYDRIEIEKKIGVILFHLIPFFENTF